MNFGNTRDNTAGGPAEGAAVGVGAGDAAGFLLFQPNNPVNARASLALSPYCACA